MDAEKKFGTELDRRTLLKAGAVAGAAAFLAACGTSGSSTAPSASTDGEKVPSEEINFANWTYYIDVDEGVETANADTFGSLARVKAEFGHKVKIHGVLLYHE